MANRCTFAPLFAAAISCDMEGENILMFSLTDGKHFVVQSATFLLFHICGEAILISSLQFIREKTKTFKKIKADEPFSNFYRLPFLLCQNKLFLASFQKVLRPNCQRINER